MEEIKRLGSQIQSALSSDVPGELIALVATTTNVQRLQSLFLEASAHLLEAHRDALARPASAALKTRRVRAKAFVDLVRARRAAVGSKRPSVAGMLAMLHGSRRRNVVDIRKAA